MPATQKNRLIAIGTALGEDKPVITAFSLTEQLGRMFQAEAELVSDDPAIDFDKMVGSNASIRLELQNGKTRFFNGYISRFTQIGHRGNDARYRATLVPWLWFLTRSADCRIFQKKKVPDIIEEVFKVHGFKDYKFKLSGAHPEWEYCVQYRETDFNFVSRLMEQEGIYYYFEHTDGVHTMMLADAASAHEVFPDSAEFVYRTPTHDGKLAEDAVTEWAIEKEVQPGMYALADFNFKNPGSPIFVNANITRKHEAAAFEIFDSPGEYDERGDGEAYAKIRIQELQSQHEILRAQATLRAVSTGCKFTLKQHPRADQNREYLITGASLHVRASEFETTGGAGEDFFSCSFTAIPASEQFRSPRITPKPLIQGPQTAIVVGKSGEEIDTDEFGRVKVQFHWDRYNKADENSSCWVRVSQLWAGKGWGAMHIPRIGQEVIVEFLEGDPDQPIITGRVYNGTAKVPYALPAEKTKSTIKSNSSKGGQGFNEIRFEDKKGSEQLFIHAEKDQDVYVKATEREFVGYDRHLVVKNDQLELVEKDKHSTVKGDRHTKIEGNDGLSVDGDKLTSVTGDEHLKVEGDQYHETTGDQNSKVTGDINIEADGNLSIHTSGDINQKADGDLALEGANIHIKSNGTLVIEASSDLCLKVGGNFVSLNSGGVFAKGSMLMLNSGGSAGSGGGCSPTAPAGAEVPDTPQTASAGGKPGEVDKAPEAPTPPKPAKYSSSAKVLKYAGKKGSPFCNPCKDDPPDKPSDLDIAIISKIAWLDGAKDKEVGDAMQFVNLPREDKWVDVPNNVKNIDRLGNKVRFKVTFNAAGSHEFKVKAVPGDDNVVYTDAEKGRNANFKYLTEEKTYTTDSDGTKVVETDFFTASAGADTFKLVAEDKDNNPPVETGLLTTKRLVYLVPVKMKDMTTNAALGTMKSEYRKNGIELIELPIAEIERMANIGSDADSNSFQQKCKTAFNGSSGKNKTPYAVIAGFTEHLAVKNPNQDMELTAVEVGPGKAAVSVPIMARGLRAGDGLDTRMLWKDIIPGEGWFVSCTFTPDGGGSAQDIAEAQCTPLPEGKSACASVRVTVTGLTAATGTLKLKVNVVDRMRAGLSFPGGNIICICTKAWWEAMSSGEQNLVAIHEMGHKIGMVVDGTGKLPDKVKTQYTAKGHLGPHCHFDLPVMDSYASANNNKCVMFGSVSDGGPSAFCEECVPAVRKIDLSAGWTV